MLTNPYETQVVGSLGVKIGGDADGAEESKCPFTSMVQGEGFEQANPEITWTAEANTRLDNVPEFARPMARSGIERYAKERGLAQIDAEVLAQAREFFGME